MKGKNLVLVLIVASLFVSIESALATSPEKGPAFICPVLGGKVGQNPNSPWQNEDHKWYDTKFVMPPGEFYTVIGPNVMVPKHATNQNGAGSPGGPFASPGEENYSPIWWTP
jgi:hypothetical protein